MNELLQLCSDIFTGAGIVLYGFLVWVFGSQRNGLFAFFVCFFIMFVGLGIFDFVYLGGWLTLYQQSLLRRLWGRGLMVLGGSLLVASICVQRRRQKPLITMK